MYREGQATPSRPIINGGVANITMTANTDKARKAKPKQSRRRKRRATLADLRDIDILRPIPETEEDDNEDEQAKWESRPRLRRCSSLEIFSLSREIFGNDIRKTAEKDFEDTCKDNTEVVRPTAKTADNRQALNQLPAEADFAINQLSPVEIEGKETKSDKVTILNKQCDICDHLGRMRDGQTKTDVMTLVFAEQDQCQTMDLDKNAQSKHDSRDFLIQVDTKAAPEIRLENAPSVFRGRRSGAAPDSVNKDVIAASTNSSGEEDNDESESDSETASIKSAVSNYELTYDINDDPDLANRVNIVNNDCKSQWDEPGKDALSLPDDDELSKDARTPTGMSNSSSDDDLDPRKLSELLKKAQGSMRRRSSMSDIYSYYVSTLPSIVERSRKSSIPSRKSSFVNFEQFQYNSEGSTSSVESNCREKSLAQVNGKSSVDFKTICTSPGILKRRMSLGDVLNSLAPRPESAPPITALENTSRDNQYVPQLDQEEHKPADQVKSTVLPSQKQCLVDTLKKKVKATLRRRNSIASTKPWTGTLETSLSQSLDLHGSREMEPDSQPCQEDINLEIPLCHTEGYRRKIATNHHPAVHGESDKADLKINTETTDDNKMTNRVKTKEESLGTSPRRSSIGGSTPTSKPSNNNNQGTKASYTNDQGTKPQPEKLSLPSNYSLNTQNRVNDPKKVEHETKRQPVKAPLTRSNSFNTPNRSNNPRRIEPKPKQQPFKSPLTRSHSLNTQKQRKHSEKLDTTDVGVETSLGKLDKTKKAAKTCAVNLVRRLTLDIGRRAAKARPDSKNEVLSSRDNEGLKNTQKELNKSSKYESSRDVLRDDKVTETNGNIKSSTSPKSGVPPSEEVERNKYSPNVRMTKSQKGSNEAQLFTPKCVHNISGKEKAKNARAPDNRQKTDQLYNDRKPSVTIMRPRSPFSFSVSTNLLAERQNIQQLPTLRDKIEKREDLEENTKSEEGSILIKNTPQTEQALKGLNVKDKELNDELEVFSNMLGELEQIPLNKNNVTPNSTTITQKTSLKKNPKTLPETGLSSPRSSLPTDQRFAALSERYAAIIARVGLSTGVISGQGAVKREVKGGIENEGTMSASKLISPVARASSLFAASSTPPPKNVGRLSPPSESITLDINNNNVTGEVDDSNVVSFQEIESNLGRSDKMSLAKVAEPIPRSITHSLQAVDAVHVKKGHILLRSLGDKMEGNGNKGEPMQLGQVKDPKIVMDFMTADSSTIATEVQKSSASGLSLTMFLEQPRKTVVSRFIHHKMAKKTPFIYTRVSVVFGEARISRVPDTMPEFTKCRAYIERVTLKSSIKPEALSIRQLLKGLGPLLEMELLAVCKESIKTLRTLDALGSLPSYISLDTIMVNPSGTVEFKQLNSGVTVDELFLAPEYTNSFSIDKTCVFGLAVTIWLAADWKLTEAQRPLLSRCFLELLWCMLEDDVTARPSLDGVLQKCESLHEEGHMSSRERCQALLWEYQAHAVISSQQESRIAGDSNSIKSRHTAVMGSITVAGNIKGFLRQTKAPKERNIFTKPQRKTSIDTTPEVPTTTNARKISQEVANLTNSPSEVRPQSPALCSIPQPSTPVVFTTVPQVSGAAMAMSPGTVSPQVHAPAFVPIPVPVGSSPLWYMTPQGIIPYQQIPPTGFFMPVDASVGSVASSESEMGDVEEARPLQVRPRQRTSSGEGERSPEIRNRASLVMKSRIPRPVAEPRRRISQPSRPSDDDFSPPVRRRAHTNAHKNNPHSLRARTPPPSFQKASHSSGTPRSQTPPVRWRRKSLNDSDDEQSRHRSYSNPSSSHPRSNHSALGSRSRPSSPGQQDQSPRPGRSRVNSPSRDSRRSSGGSRPPSPVKSRSSSPVLDLISKFEKLSSDPAGESKSVTALLNKFGSSSLLSEDRLEKKQFKAHRDPNRAKAGPLRPSSAMEQTSELRAPPGGSLSRSWPMNRNPAQGESTGDEDSPYVSKDSYISSLERNPRDHRHRTGSSLDGERSLSNKSRELQAYLGKAEREKYLRDKEEVSLSVSRQRTWSSLENLNNAVDDIGSMNNAIMRKSSSMKNFSQRDQSPVRTKGISTSYERVNKAGEYGTRLTIHSTKKDKHHVDSKQDRLNWSDIQFEPVRDSNKGITSITSPKIPVGLAVKDNRSENAALFKVEPSRTGPFSPSLFSPSAVQGSMFPFHHPVKLERSNTPLSPPASLSPSLKECKPTNYFSNVSFDQEKPENDIPMAKTPEKKTWGEEHNQIRIEAMSSSGGSSAENSGVRSDRASSTGSGSDRRRKSSCDSASSDTVFTSNIGGNPDYLKRFEMRISRTSSSGSAGEVEPDSSRLRADSGSASSNGYHSKSQSILDGTTPTVEKARPPSLALSHDDTKYETTPRKDGLNPSGNPHLFETQKDQGRRKARPVSLVLSPGEESSSMHTPIAQPCGCAIGDSRPRSKKPASQPTTPTVKPDQSSRRQSTPNALQSSKGSKDVGDRIDKSYTKSLVPRDQLNTGRPASPSLTKFREQMAKRASRPNSPSSSTRTHADSDDVFDFPTVDDKVGRSNSRGATLPENENKEEFVERFVHDTSLQMQSSTSNFKKSTSMGNLNRNPQEESRAKRKISDTVVSRSAAIVEKTSSGFYTGPDSNNVSNPVIYSKTKNPLVEKLNLSSFTGSSTSGAVSPTSSASTASLSPTSRLPINQFMFYKPQNESSDGKQSLKGAGVVITDTSRQRVDKKVESREVNGKGDQGDDKKTRGTREDDKERRKENKPALQQKETEISKICAAHSETVSAIFNAARRASLTPRNDSDESDSSKERVDLDPKNTGLKYTKPLRKDNNKVSTDHELSPTFAQSTSSTPKSVTDKPNQTSDRPMSRNSNSSSSRRSSLTPRNDSNGSNTSRYQPGSHLSKSSSPRRYSLTPRHDSNSSNTSEGRPESQLSNVSSPRRSSLTPRRNSGTPESLDRSMSPHDKSRSSSALSDEGFNALIKSVRRRSLTPQNDSDRSTDSLERSMSPESRIANALAKRPPSPGRVDSKDLLGHLVKKVLTSAAAKQGSGSDQVSIVDPDTPRSKTKRRPSPGPIESSVKRSEKSTPKRSPSPAAGKQRGDEAKGRSTPVQTPRRGSQDNRPAENSQYTENTPRKDEGQQKKEEIKASIVTNQLNAAQDVSNGDEKTRSARASQPKMKAGACAEQDVLSKLVDMIHEEFAFDGYLDDGVEDVNMAEYIMSLSGMNEEMFKEAVSDQYGDLYWDDDLLEEMYLVVTKGQQTRRPTLQFSESTVSDYSLSGSVLSRDGSVSEPGTGYLNSLSRTSSDRSSVEIRDYVLLSLGEPSEFLPFRVIAPDTIRDINDELVPLFDDYHKVMKVKLSPSINELTERLGAKILEISQQLTLERKAKRKNVTSFNKVAEIDHKKDVKDLAANLLREIEESDRKIIYLKYIQRRLRNIYAERFGLNHTLLFSFATSYGADDVMLEPSQQNNLLSFSPLWDQRGADMSDAHGESTRGPMLQYGTMLGLFSYLFGRFAMSQAYVRYFLYTYRYCATPSDLFNFIRDKCRASLRAADSESGQPLSHQLQIRYRALDILAEWIDSCYRFDFKPDPGLLGQLVAFIQEEFVPVDRTERGAMLLELISERHRKEEDEDAEETPDTMAVLQAELPQGAPSIMDAARKLTPRRKSKPTVQCFKRGSPQAASFYKPTANLKAMSVTDHSSRTVAQQLTLIQQELFTRSHSIHFLNSRTLGVGVGRSSPTKEGSSLLDNMLGFSAGKRRGSLLPNEPTDLSSSGEHNLFAGSSNMDGSLEAMLEHAQDVSMWVAVEICSAASVKSQLVLVTKFVSIAKHCAEMRNFATCVQIIDALEMFVIKQLPVWKQVPNKVIQSLEELKAIKVLLKTDSLWLLRDHAVREKPTIPCTLLFLMHIQQQEIGGFTLANGMFKWTKMRSIGRLVDQIRLFKQMRYAFEANDSMKEHLVQRILECRDLNLHTLASENTANFHLSSSQNSRKFQDAFKKMKATFGHG